jgi:hypothetical protein
MSMHFKPQKLDIILKRIFGTDEPKSRQRCCFPLIFLYYKARASNFKVLENKLLTYNFFYKSNQIDTLKSSECVILVFKFFFLSHDVKNVVNSFEVWKYNSNISLRVFKRCF